MKFSNYLRVPLLAMAAGTTGIANAAPVPLDFDFIPASNVFAQTSIVLTSGVYTLTVTATSGGEPALLAQQIGNSGGLGIKLAAEASTTWGITEGEELIFSLEDGSGPVGFSDLAIKTGFGNHLFGNERATVTINGTAYEMEGGARGTGNGDAPLFDGANNATGASWASAFAATAKLAPSTPASGTSAFKLINLLVVADSDVDNDAIPNVSDNCVTTPNFSQANADGDAFGDACDDDPDGDGVDNLVFDFEPAADVFGLSSQSFTSIGGNYTLTVTATSGGNPAELAQQTGNNGGLGVKLAAEAGNTWGISGDETVTFTLNDASGAVSFSNFAFKTVFGNHLFANERASVIVDGTGYELTGGPRGTSNADAPLFDGSFATGASWSSDAGATVSIRPETAASGSTQFRLLSVQMDYDPSFIDSDSDGISDAADNCPNDANAGQENLDNDNTGDVCDPDIDGDGVLNSIESAVGTNPNDPSDGAAAEQAALDMLAGGGASVEVPVLPVFGMIALALSILGFGIVRARKQ